MNKVILIGRLTRDPELRYTGSNRAVTQITIAVNRNFTNQNGEREADFINVVIWDKQAENVAKYLPKGRLVSIEGRIQTRNYDNSEGKKVYVTEVMVNNISFLESKKDDTLNMNNLEDCLPTGLVKPEQIDNLSMGSDPFANFGNEVQINDDDLPF